MVKERARASTPATASAARATKSKEIPEESAVYESSRIVYSTRASGAPRCRYSRAVLRPTLPRLVVALVFASGCGGCPSGRDAVDPARAPAPATPIDHVLVTDGPDGVQLWHGRGGDWRVFRRLPSSARAVRVSPDGRHVAWVNDFVAKDGAGVSKGYAWLDGADAQVSLGVLGLRKREAMGLTIGDDGTAVYLDESGSLVSRASDGKVARLAAGIEPLAGPGGRLAFAPLGGGCLVTQPINVNACGGLLSPLAWSGDSLAYSAEHFVFVVTGQDATPYPSLRDVSAAALRDGRLAVVRTTEFENVTWDVIELATTPAEKPRQLMRASVVVGLAWDDDGLLLALHRRTRANLYELLLAHAPFEFQGESLPGEPVRIDPATGAATPADDLPSRRVRVWRPVR